LDTDEHPIRFPEPTPVPSAGATGQAGQANYEYDSATNSWCASVDELPGVYAQADTIENVRSELAEIIEEYVFVLLQEGHPLPEFKKFRKVA